MAITLPQRKAGRKVQRNTPRSITAGDVPTVTPARDPGVRAVSGAFGELGAAALQRAGAQFQATGSALQKQEAATQKALLAAQEKVRKQDDTNESNISIGALDGNLEQIVDNAGKGADISQKETLITIGALTNKAFQDSVASYKGSASGKRDYEAKARLSLNKSHLTVGKAHRQAKTDRGIAEVKKLSTQVSNAVFTNPEIIFDVLENDLPQILEAQRNLFSAAQADNLLQEITSESTQSALSGMALKVDLKEMRRVIGSQKVRNALGDQYDEAVEAFFKLEADFKKDFDASNEGRIEAFENTFGFPPRTSEETARAIKILPSEMMIIESKKKVLTKEGDMTEEEANEAILRNLDLQTSTQEGVSDSKKELAKQANDNLVAQENGIVNRTNSEFFSPTGEFNAASLKSLNSQLTLLVPTTTPGDREALVVIQNKAIALLRPQNGKPPQAQNVSAAALLAVKGTENPQRQRTQFDIVQEYIQNTRVTDPTKKDLGDPDGNGEALEKLISTQEATGIGSAIGTFVEELGSQLLPSSIDVENAPARKELNSLMYQIVVAGEQSKKLKGEFEFLVKTLRPPGALSSPAVTSTILKGMKKSFQRMLKGRVSQLSTPGFLSEKGVEGAKADIARLVNILNGVDRFDLSLAGSTSERIEKFNAPGKADFADAEKFMRSVGPDGMRKLEKEDPKTFKIISNIITGAPQPEEEGPAEAPKDGLTGVMKGVIDRGNKEDLEGLRRVLSKSENSEDIEEALSLIDEKLKTLKGKKK